MAVNTEGQQAFSIINTPMTVSAMRDNGYKSTTHALAELIDNSIEAGATQIEVFGLSQPAQNLKAKSMRLAEIAVLDNGEGMDHDTLRGSLRYGHGTRIKRRGIGRFGMGLPNSSMSQARRVDVWSWQSGVSNALHTWLSIDDVESGMEEIPSPTRQPIPKSYHYNSLSGVGDSGTLVVWSDLDRVEWTRASTVFKHTENLIGRIYRRFLTGPLDRLSGNDDRGKEIGLQRRITLVPLESIYSDTQTMEDDIVEVRPNDPLYLMPNTSCPELFGDGPMFQELEGSPFIVPVEHKGKIQKVRIRASYARPLARDSSLPDAKWPENLRGLDAGRTVWGKHADSNMGVSVMRAHREIEIDPSWVSGDDPRERWWTVEVDFPTALDEIFGVTNNKQGTMTFQRLSHFTWQREALPEENSVLDVKRRMEEDGDPRVYLLEVREQIDRAINLMRKRVRRTHQKRGNRRIIDEKDKADVNTTRKIKARVEVGKIGDSDRAAETGTQEEHQEAQVESLENHHFDREAALKIIKDSKNNRVRWIVSSQASPAFFDINSLPNIIQVVLNDEHPVYSHLYELLNSNVDELDEEEIRKRLAKATAAFHILIYAWARYEDEQTDKAKRPVRNARLEWGKYAEEFFDDDDGIPVPTGLI